MSSSSSPSMPPFHLPSSLNPFSRTTILSYLRSGCTPPFPSQTLDLDKLRSDIQYALNFYEVEVRLKEQQLLALEIELGSLLQMRQGLRALSKHATGLEAPIRKLPAELLMKIFRLVSSKKSSYSLHLIMQGDMGVLLYSSIRDLAQTCSRWRQVAFSCHDLWGSMDINLSATEISPKVGKVVLQHLRRSGNAPLQLSIQNTSWFDLGPKGQEVWDALIQESRRWKSVKLNIPMHVLKTVADQFKTRAGSQQKGESIFCTLESLHIENLEELTMHHRDPIISKILQTLPLLRSFHVSGGRFYGMDACTFDISRITRLSISKGHYEGRSLAQLFMKCPALTDVDLSGFVVPRGQSHGRDHLSSSGVYVHTRLTKLTLTKESYFDTSAAGLRSVSFPNLTHLKLVDTYTWPRDVTASNLSTDIASLIVRSKCTNLRHITFSKFHEPYMLRVIDAAKESLQHLKIIHPASSDHILMPQLSTLFDEVDTSSTSQSILAPNLVSLEVVIAPAVAHAMLNISLKDVALEICDLVESRCKMVPVKAKPKWVLATPFRQLGIHLDEPSRPRDAFFAAIVDLKRHHRLVSRDHFKKLSDEVISTMDDPRERPESWNFRDLENAGFELDIS
ncbi:hypothetical protein DFJ43DRAFT_435601 [Lentinula guzmanii]|uniref:F-box domain-containing protein n=1 Tax=Lentinula guzmanii TaxID=2804957 RepID=A0AA38JL15_9AGAR|nr:hypothetical protein DFJ43DRAFT_435601 [Lentinula guzmanii]